MLTLTEAADRAKVSKWTVIRWASPKIPASRRLRVVRIGKTTRIRESDLERFFQANEYPKPAK